MPQLFAHMRACRLFRLRIHCARVTTLHDRRYTRKIGIEIMRKLMAEAMRGCVAQDGTHGWTLQLVVNICAVLLW